MAIVYEKLLNYRIPDVHQTLTKRDTAFYALSCGLGADPMDERQLDYVDFHREMRVLPSMPVVMGYPGLFMRDPATGIDAVKVVHGEQAVEIFAPLPAEGKIIGRNRVASLVDKGTGRGALMVTEREVIDAASGARLALATATVFFARGWGVWRAIRPGCAAASDAGGCAGFGD